MTRRTRIALLLVPLVAAVGIVLRWGLPAWRTHRANVRELKQDLPQIPRPKSSDRILVLAPHCDDETLATGGLLEMAAKAKAQVRVVLLTNGDGFHYAAMRFFEEVDVSPGDYLKFALERQRETLTALSQFGVSADQVSFLGYPDGGTARMWLYRWDPANPYTSPRTRKNHNPYTNSLHPGAPYCGRAVVDDLKTVVRQFKPTAVYCPHPDDDHPDHWALYCYTLSALYELHLLDRAELRLYLVHRGDWPVPQGLHPQVQMSPPAALMGLDTQWGTLPLDSATVSRKHKALLSYISQLLVMRRFLTSFIRSSELFGSRPFKTLPSTQPGAIKIDGVPEDWKSIPPAIRDPSPDLAATSGAPAGDITALYAARDSGHLLLRLDTWRPVSSRITYTLHLHPIIGGRVGPPQTYVLTPGRTSPEVISAATGGCLEVSVPFPSQAEGVILGADARLHSYVLDRTASALLLQAEPNHLLSL